MLNEKDSKELLQYHKDHHAKVLLQENLRTLNVKEGMERQLERTHVDILMTRAINALIGLTQVVFIVFLLNHL